MIEFELEGFQQKRVSCRRDTRFYFMKDLGRIGFFSVKIVIRPAMLSASSVLPI